MSTLNVSTIQNSTGNNDVTINPAGDIILLGAEVNMSGANSINMPVTSNGRGIRTVSTGTPVGGNEGDIWYQVST